MKYKSHILFALLLFVSAIAVAQDKVFLRNGKVIPCKIVAISEKTISYKDTTQSPDLITLSKNDILLAEYKSETVYMFSKEESVFQEEGITVITSTMPEMNETRAQRAERKMKEWKEKEALLPNNILGFYIPELVLGRLTVSYERLLANKTMGIKIPLSLTYDGLGALAEFSSNNSNASNTNTNSTNTNTNSSSNNGNYSNNNAPVKRNRGTGFITGVDINYYHDLKPQLKYYFGPRIRYGTDMMLGGIEGLTFQLQNGIFKSSGKKMTSTLGFGVGFFKLSSKYAGRGGYDTKQVYPWASFTWRLGFRL